MTKLAEQSSPRLVRSDARNGGRPRSGQQRQSLRIAGAHAKSTEVAPVGCEYARRPPLGHCGNHAIDQPKVQLVELGVELERPSQIGSRGGLQLVARGW